MPSTDTRDTVRTHEVLIVDDDPDIRAFVRAALTYEGFAVREAGDGREGLEQLDAARPDLLLLDLNMPGVTGWDVIEALRQAGSTLPVVIMTAGYRAREEAERYGAAGFLGKPFDLATMYLTIDRILGRCAGI